MGAWAMPQPIGIQLPPGVAVASMGRRVGAWILDAIISGLLTLIPLVIALVAGAVSLNRQALDQIETGTRYPFANVTAPLVNVRMGTLVVAAVVFVGLRAAYHAGSWVAYGGTPAQRMLGLHVAEYRTGRNLTFGAATFRWFVLVGLADTISAIVLVLVVQSISTIPTREWLDPSYSAFRGSFAGLNGFTSLLSWGGALWSLVLLITAGARPDHRGLHDRWSGSIVVGKAQPVPAMYWPTPPGWQGQGGWTPQGSPGAPYYPQYPPQAAPGGPYYPPQPGAPAYPPQPGPAAPISPSGGAYWPPVSAPTYPGYPNAPQAPQAGPGPGSGTDAPPSTPPEPPPSPGS